MKLQIKPTIKQGRAWIKLRDDHTKFLVFGGGAGGGKSWLGCEWLLSMCLAYPGTKWFIGREELKRLMVSSYVTFLKVCAFHNIPRSTWKLNGQYNYIDFTNGSRIDLLDLKFLPSDPLYERFGSTEYTGGWIEEAGEVHFDAFDTLKSRIGRHLNKEYSIPSKIFITCNPKKNWLYIEVYKPWKEKILNPIYYFIQSLYNDNPYTAEEYGENLKLIKDKQKKERLMKGNWEYDDDPALLFDYDSICDIFTNQANRGKKYLTIDVAGAGKDKTILFFWDGLFLEDIEVMENISSEELDKILIECKIPRSHCLADNDGVGYGLVKDTKGIKGFVNNSSPIKPKSKHLENLYNYRHLKAQCWFLLADYVNSGQIGCFRDVPTSVKKLLIEDLEIMKEKDMDKEQKKSVITKEEIKEMMGRSTDLGDAMMMRMWFELKTPVLTI